jgi:predicted lipoprotein with Yx(FWY)xxD motif
MTMHRSHAFALALGLMALLAAGCGGDSTGSSGSAGAATKKTAGSSGTTQASGPAASTVALSDSKFGKILTTSDGRTLYLFTPDTGSTSTCTGGCASAWPPLPGPATGRGVGTEDLGTTTRDDGSVQATFYGHPVYTYGGDAGPGETTGEGVGGKWYVIDAEGNAVTGTGATTSTARAATSAGGY